MAERFASVSEDEFLLLYPFFFSIGYMYFELGYFELKAVSNLFLFP